MAKKNLEDLANELGYKNFKQMKESIGGSHKGFFSSLFSRKSKKETSPTKEGAEESGVSSKAIPFLDIIAKNSISLPGMARDVNVLRQNIAKLVKLKGGEAVSKADKFFKTEDQRESELEGARAKSKATPEKGGKETKPKEEGGGGLGSLLDMLNPVKLIGGLITGIVGGFASLFSGGSILAILSKIFVPAMLIGGLINGILDGIKVWKESGSIVDTLIAALGGFLKFITFGLFGEKELREGMDSALKFMMPMLLGVTELFDKFITSVKNFGFPGLTIPLKDITTFTLPKALGGGTIGPMLNDITIPPYYPFKKDTSSTKPESYTSSATTSLKEMSGKLDSGEGVFYDKAAKERLEDKPKEKEKQEKQKASQESLAETVSKSPTPDPYSPLNAEKSQDAAKGFLSSKVGVNVDPSSSTGYTDQATGKPVTEEEVRRKIVAVGGEPTKILQMAKGESKSPAPVGAETSAASATGGGGEVSSGGSMPSAGGSASPSPVEAPATSAPSGNALSQDSAMVAEGQRMDAAADAGTVISAPSVNNTSGQKAPSSESVADAYNSSFIKNYLTA